MKIKMEIILSMYIRWKCKHVFSYRYVIRNFNIVSRINDLLLEWKIRKRKKNTEDRISVVATLKREK